MTPSHLRLTHVQNNNDIDRLAAFNAMIHNTDLVGEMTRNLLRHHPTIQHEWDKWLFIEDTQTGEIVSALCLITWHLAFDTVTLKAGEVGIVGTHEAYRGQGLSRQLMTKHRELLAGYDLSHIQGIPYYYRQFGYEYAIPLEGGHRLYLETVPSHPTPYTVRLATPADIPNLARWYAGTNQGLGIHTKRDSALWEYLLGVGLDTETAADTWIIQAENGEGIGYFRIARHNDFGPDLVLNEVSAIPYDAGLRILQHTKEMAVQRGAPYIRLNIAASHPLIAIARQYHTSDLGTYAWQILLPDPAAFLQTLAPVLEKRLAASAFAGLSKQVALNAYRYVYALNFHEGRLHSVDTLGLDHAEDSDLSLPPTLLPPLLLGHRTHTNLAEFFPDVICHAHSQYLLETLFPKVNAFLYTQY